MYGSTGRVTAVVSLFRDVTRAREAEQLKDDFLSLVSHELRTPLTTIQGAAHILLAQGDDLAPEARAALRLDIASESDRLGRMLRNMLSLAAYQAGRLHVERDPFLVQPLLRRVAAEAQTRYPAHRVAFHGPHDLPVASGDEELIEQVVRNLVENAAKYSPDGGAITLHAEGADDGLIVRVADEGPGIAPEEQAKIFGRFHRASSGTQGMGLGLYLWPAARGGAWRAHLGGERTGTGGDVQLHPARSNRRRRKGRGMVKKPVILVVDDEPPIVRLVRLKLEGDGFAVHTAHRGEDALALLEDEPIDLVVLDVTMPGMDGFETLRRIRAHANVPVIMLTARTLDGDKLRGLTSGADDYLTKPFNPDELTARIVAVLRRSDGRQTGADKRLEYGDLVIDLAQRRVTRRDEEIRLSRTEWELLAELATNAGKVLLHGELLTRIWGSEFRDESQYLRTWVSRLRHKLGDDALITTFPGLGYRMEPPLD